MRRNVTRVEKRLILSKYLLKSTQIFIDLSNPADGETANLSVHRESICNLQVFRMDLTRLLL